MNKIGFKNFRRFTEFPVTEYGGITFLVGKNNSGKSTMVKALMLIVDFLKSNNINDFSFGSQNVENVNIVTFERALNNEAKRKKEDLISYHIEFDDFIFDIEIFGELDKTIASIKSFKIQDKKERLDIEIKPKYFTMTVSHLPMLEYDSITYDLQTEEKKIKYKIAELQKILDDKSIKKTDPLYLETADKLNFLKDKYKLGNQPDKNKDDIQEQDENQTQEYVEEGKISPEEYVFTARIDSDLDVFSIFEKFVEEYTNRFDYYVNRENVAPIRKKFLEDYFYSENAVENKQKNSNNEESESEPEKDVKETYIAFYRYYKVRFERFFERYHSMTNSINYKYLGAKLEKQSALFAIRDKNNTLAQAIFEYKQLGIDKAIGSDAHNFVKRWMSKVNFDIGDDIEMKLHAGEAYEVNIITGKDKVALADKGTGSIQAMLLILRLATAIYKKTKSNIDNIVIIEEPELNLHPALQSKLADLFYEVYDKFGIRLIIETHSEYLIRKTQLIVKDNELEAEPNENPFTVFYFDLDKGLWKINYREDGKFIDEFGKGFYDESANLTFNLL